jgi:hypothetical protein
MPLQASTLAKPYAGESEGRHPASRWGGWGSEPPDPGSALTKETRNPLIHIAYRCAWYNSLSRTHAKVNYPLI